MSGFVEHARDATPSRGRTFAAWANSLADCDGAPGPGVSDVPARLLVDAIIAGEREVLEDAAQRLRGVLASWASYPDSAAWKAARASLRALLAVAATGADSFVSSRAVSSV